MGDHSLIEWTDATWNPVTGCTKVSEGCRHCYAERVLPRTKQPFDQIVLHEDRLDAPLHWKKPRRVFVNSLSDLFHQDIPAWFIQRLWDVFAACPQHTFQVLTKRPERMQRMASMGLTDDPNLLPNVWLGVSVEDQKTANERIPLLLRTPAAVHFISAEPLLGPMDVKPWLMKLATSGPDWTLSGGTALEIADRILNWVIVGGESGRNARPMHPGWARSIRDQCVTAGVPFFFKQWGEWQNGSASGCKAAIVLNDGTALQSENESMAQHHQNEWHRYNPCTMAKVGKKAAGRLLDGREWNDLPRGN